MGFLDRWRDKPEPKPDRAPRAASGRAHTNGFLEVEELNNDLIGQQGLSIYDKMYRTDGDTRQAVQIVSNPIISGTWVVTPAGGEDADEKARKNAEILRWALFDVMSPNLIGHLAEMLPVLVRSGFAPYEQLWTTAEKDGKTYLVPRKLDLRLPRTIYRWFQDKYGDLHSIVQQLPVPLSDLQVGRPGVATARTASNGERLSAGEVELLSRNLVYYRLGGEGDNWEGVSLLRPAYKHWLMKDSIERIDAIAQEREAMGIPICYPPMGASPRQLDEMEAVLAAMRTNEQGYIVAPGPKAGSGAPEGQGWLIEILGYDRTGSGRDPQPSLKYHTDKIAAAFISEFMRLGHGQVGARATAQVQADPFLMSVEALVGMIENILNDQLVRPFCAYNYGEDECPRLHMSLVDSTSLTTLADYVLKLTQVGALFPDKELENFLRSRADLPGPDPEAVKKRKDDDKLRREIVTGGPPGGNGDAVGQNARPGTPHGTKTAKPKSSGASKKLDDLDDLGRRIRYRPRNSFEQDVDLDGIEDFLDGAPDMFARHCQDCVYNMARGKPHTLRKNLHAAIQECYTHGYKSVQDELMLAGKHLTKTDYGNVDLPMRAKHAATYIECAMELAHASAGMIHGNDEAKLLAATEIEGFRKLRHLAMDQGTGAFNAGRHDAITLASQQFPQIGVIYSALLDNRTCDSCLMADDGIPRTLDDPVRLDRQPPNRHCHSTAGGHNWCRCIEIPTLIQ